MTVGFFFIFETMGYAGNRWKEYYLMDIFRLYRAIPPLPSFTTAVASALPLNSAGTFHVIMPVDLSIDMPSGAPSNE